MNNYPVPFEKTQRAVAISFAVVLKKKNNNKRLSETPYAHAFFCEYFGTSNPNKPVLQLLVNADYTKPEMIKIIDKFLCSNGQSYRQLSSVFVKKAFPSIDDSREVRFSNHCTMKFSQSNKVKENTEKVRDAKVELLTSEMMSYSALGLSAWIDDTDNFLSEVEQITALNNWYDKHVTSEHRFRDLYSELSPSTIAYDLSLG